MPDGHLNSSQAGVCANGHKTTLYQAWLWNWCRCFGTCISLLSNTKPPTAQYPPISRRIHQISISCNIRITVILLSHPRHISKNKSKQFCISQLQVLYSWWKNIQSWAKGSGSQIERFNNIMRYLQMLACAHSIQLIEFNPSCGGHLKHSRQPNDIHLLQKNRESKNNNGQKWQICRPQ